MEPLTLRKLLLSFPGAEEDEPFGPGTVVYKIMGKMFALTNYDSNPLCLNLKCDPAKALELRDQYAAIEPGYHMNKKHWNTLTLDGSLPDTLVSQCVSHSHELVRASLSKKQRVALENTPIPDQIERESMREEFLREI